MMKAGSENTTKHLIYQCEEKYENSSWATKQNTTQTKHLGAKTAHYANHDPRWTKHLARGYYF